VRRKGMVIMHVTLGDNFQAYSTLQNSSTKFQFRYPKEELQLDYSFNSLASPKNSMAGKVRILVLGATGYM
jgi:hypothetical protein